MSEAAGDHYRRVPFSELPGWDGDDHLDAFRAFCESAPGVVAGDGATWVAAKCAVAGTVTLTG